MKTTIAAAGLALGMAATPASAIAGANVRVTGASALLDAGRAAQLGRWLGAGDIRLDPIYRLRPGASAADFHRAADGHGATFTLLDVSNPAGASYLVGGYDPQSWSAADGWHETPRDWQRAAFLFNMTDPAVYRQVASTYVLPSQGLRQTFNDAGLGPVFGSGPDLYVDGKLSTAISWQLSYGNPLEEGMSIIDRSLHGENVRIGALEVFAVSPVPEPGMAALLAAGLPVLMLGLGVAARGRGRGEQQRSN